MTTPAAGGEFTGPGLRGLRPGPGDQVLIDGTLLPGLRVQHWMRVLQVSDPYAAALELDGYLLPRPELGETTLSPVYRVLVDDPAALVVRRPAGVPPLEVPPLPPVAAPGLVEQLVAPATAGPVLPAAVQDALARPDAHRPGDSGVPRWPE
jgi:hypothetical protein